ncbi:competence protein TfoX [Aggregicoccus sp. 17bor-14]|uniref:TfoX/Sxy family protein n=1 Tax=Myxococcaceae TaxID=31 RepID=UPI00129C67A9|nr:MULTISPECIES: TfoX/Sxy family protein [Myxococcaceae]MBF5043265.1 TfoX/Sxy family protein [Simulacricoccus sp. 17bor-14]MRI89022.1 competence protein TfoX [Aggregicoccus sp. 17bor-14]
MARDRALMEEAVDLLRMVGPVQGRGMFGGWGLYLHGRMFGLIAEGQLFLKTDELTRPDFERSGCRPFVYEGGGKSMATSYWTPPEAVADDPRAITPWARRAVEAAERAALRKQPKKRAATKRAAAEAEPVKRVATKKGAAQTKRPVAKNVPAKQAEAKPIARRAATKKRGGRK